MKPSTPNTPNTFKLRGKTYRLSKTDVERAASKIDPRPTDKYAVLVGGRIFPPKQLIEASLQIPPMAFTTLDSQRILAKLGFEILSSERQAPPQAGLQKVGDRSLQPPYGSGPDLLQWFAASATDDRAQRLKNSAWETWLGTRAKELFEAYLFASGLGRSAVEREQLPDFIITTPNTRIGVLIAELAAVDFDVVSEIEFYDPCRPIRDRIITAEQEFAPFRDISRCLTLHSRCTPWPIFDWRLIYGAMRDTGETLRPKAEERAIKLSGERSDPSPLDAVIVLEQLRTGYIRFKGHIRELEARNGRALSESEYIAELHRARGTERDIVLSRLRVIVHENPDGANPLPKEIFRGPYDEWYGATQDGQIGRTFVGDEVRSLEKDGLLHAS